MDGAVPDANTLIYLAKSGMLEILDRYEIFITEEVFEEAVERGKEKGEPDAYLLENYIEENWNVKTIDKDRLESEVKYFGAIGEASVYLLADRKDIPAVTSDKVAMNKMKRKQIEVLRTDMMLLKRFKNGQVSKPELREGLGQLNSVGGTTGQRINFLMQKAEEHEKGEK